MFCWNMYKQNHLHVPHEFVKTHHKDSGLKKPTVHTHKSKFTTIDKVVAN